MTKWMGVSLPIKTLEKIDQMVKKFQYSSRADFVREAVRRELERIGGN